MNPPHLQTVIIEELARLESLGYIGLIGRKYLSSEVTTPDSYGNRVRAINLNSKAGWAIVAYGKPGEEQKYKFLRDTQEGWVYDGVEAAETLH